MRNEVLLRWESICIYFVDGIIPQGAQNLLNFVGVKPVALEDAAKLENCEILSRCGLKWVIVLPPSLPHRTQHSRNVLLAPIQTVFIMAQNPSSASKTW